MIVTDGRYGEGREGYVASPGKERRKGRNDLIIPNTPPPPPRER